MALSESSGEIVVAILGRGVITPNVPKGNNSLLSSNPSDDAIVQQNNENVVIFSYICIEGTRQNTIKQNVILKA